MLKENIEEKAAENTAVHFRELLIVFVPRFSLALRLPASFLLPFPSLIHADSFMLSYRRVPLKFSAASASNLLPVAGGI